MCSEIILRSKQVCNLSEVVVREPDTLDDLKRKVRLATILGTLQATLTDFKYLSEDWKKNTEEEALLGVSLTGIMDHPLLNVSVDLDYENAMEKGEIRNKEFQDRFGSLGLKDWLQELRGVAIETNVEWAKKLGINQSTAITAVKPSGTVSQLVDCASGIHARHNQYYLRSVRNDIKDPLSKAMIAMGFPYEVDVMNPSNYVFSFPIKAPKSSVFRSDRSAIEQLELWKIYQIHWCEHKPSVTISVGDDEWMEVGAWVYKNWNYISGVSFLPRFDHVYKQAPYQDLTEDEYNKWLTNMPKKVDWSILSEFEKSDLTIGVGELACSSGNCEIA